MRWLLIALLLLALPVMAENESSDLRGELHKANFEEALTKIVLRGELVVDKVESEKLDLILSELKDLKFEIEEMDVETFIEQRSELKDQVRGIVSKFRESARNLFTEEERAEFRKEIKSELLEKHKQKRKELKNKLQARLVEKKLKMLNLTDDDLVEKIKSGEITVKELRESIREHIMERRDGMKEEMREEMRDRIEERKEIREHRKDEIKSKMENKREKVKERRDFKKERRESMMHNESEDEAMDDIMEEINESDIIEDVVSVNETEGVKQ